MFTSYEDTKAKKNQARKKFKKLRSQNVQTPHTGVTLNILDSIIEPGSTWLGYKSILSEWDLSFIYSHFSNVNWGFPRIEGETMNFYKVSNPLDDQLFEKSPFGILEPKAKDSLDTIQGALIPALSADQKGVRLGYGKGFYDKYLKNFKGLKIAIISSEFFSRSSLPSEDTDVEMDYILTDKFIAKPIV